MKIRLWWCVLGVGVVGGVIGAAAALRLGYRADAADPPGYAKVVDVQKLRLIGDDGKVRAVLAIVDGTAALLMFTPQEEPVLQICANKAGNAAILLHDRSGTTRLAMGLVDGNPSVQLAGPTGKSRCEIVVGTDGMVALRLFDGGKGTLARAALLTGKKGPGCLMFVDKAGKIQWSAP